MKVLLILVTLFIFSGCPEEEKPSEIIETPILIPPDECVLVCEGSIIRKGSCEICQDSSETERPMCEDWTHYYPNVNHGITYVLP